MLMWVPVVSKPLMNSERNVDFFLLEWRDFKEEINECATNSSIFSGSLMKANLFNS